MPVWCEVVADTLTPVACFANVVGDGRGFPLRVGRGRRALGPLLVRRAAAAGHPHRARAGGGDHGAARPGAVRRRDPGRGRGPGDPLPVAELAGLPPLHGGLVGYLGYDVVREVERLPDIPGRRPGPPRRRPGRDRPVLSPSTTGASASCWSTTWSSPTALTAWPTPTRCSGLRGGLHPPRRAGRRLRPRPGLAGPMVAAPRPGLSRPTADAHHDLRGVPGGHRRGQGAHHGGRHLPGRALAALRPRARGRPLRRLPRAAPAQPEPVHVLPALPRGHRRGRLARADGAPARRRGHLAADRRHRGRGARTSSTTACSRASWPRTPRSWPSTSCWSTWPATTWAGSSASAPRRSTS